MAQQMPPIAMWTGATVRTLREALRLSCRDFAAKLGASERSLSNWERHTSKPLTAYGARLMDEALRRCDDHTKAVFAKLLDGLQAQPEPYTPQQIAANGFVDRPSRAMVDTLRASLRAYYLADNAGGPRVLLPVVSGHVAQVEQATHDAEGALLNDLLQVGAGYAEFAGWLAQDSGDHMAATRLYRQALEWAQVGGDPRMAAFVLMRRATQAAALRDGRYATQLAAAAQRDSTPATARVRAIALQTEAIGHAMIGDVSSADRALDTAAALVEQGADIPLAGDPSDGRYWELSSYLRISRARVHVEAGRGLEAVTAWQGVLHDLPVEFVRDRAQYTAHLAHALMIADAPDQAVEVAGEALSIALATGSARTVDDLRRLDSRFHSRPHHQARRRLHAMLERT